MANRYNWFCLFFTCKPFSYGYFHLLTSFHANFHPLHWIPKFIIDGMKDHVKMHDFIFLRKANTSYMYCNQTQHVAWSMSWTPLFLISLMIFCMGVNELEGWFWSFSFSIVGEVWSNGVKHIKAPKNYSHKYNVFAIKVFDNIWTSHFGFFFSKVYLISFRLNLFHYLKKSNKYWRIGMYGVYLWQNNTHHKVSKFEYILQN
jgi:hypothetical protein